MVKRTLWTAATLVLVMAAGALLLKTDATAQVSSATGTEAKATAEFLVVGGERVRVERAAGEAASEQLPERENSQPPQQNGGPERTAEPSLGPGPQLLERTQNDVVAPTQSPNVSAPLPERVGP